MKKCAKYIVASHVSVHDIEELILDAQKDLYDPLNHSESTKKAIQTLHDAYNLTSDLNETQLKWNAIKRDTIKLLSEKLIHDPAAQKIINELKNI